MFGMSPPKKPMKRTTPETVTRSECCNFSVTPTTPDDFSKIKKDDRDTWVMTLQFICNNCGKHCKVKEIPIDE